MKVTTTKFMHAGLARMLTALCLVIAALPAVSAQIRFATVSWEQEFATSSSTIRFNVETAWRRSDFGTPNVGNTVNLGFNFDFGDSTSQALSATVDQVLAADDWFYATSSLSHTYAATPNNGFDFLAGFSGCCTLSSLLNDNANQGFDIRSQVHLDNNSPTRSARSTSGPILYVALGSGVSSVLLPAAVYGGDSVSYFLDDLGGSSTQPGFMSLNQFGMLSVNTSAPSLQSGLYDLRLHLESRSFDIQPDSTTPLYMLVNVICTTGPSCSNPPNVVPELPVGVPEPDVIVLMLFGVAGLVSARRRRQG